MNFVQSFRMKFHLKKIPLFLFVKVLSHPVHLKSVWLYFSALMRPFSWKEKRFQGCKNECSCSHSTLLLFSSVFTLCIFLALTSGLPKSEGPLQPPLLTLGGSSSDQASTSKQPLYGASGSRDDIFSLGGLSYLTSSKSCGSRSLGCVGASRCPLPPTAPCLPPQSSFLFFCSALLPFTNSCPSAGLPCWTARRRPQEPPTKPCWRDLLCNPSRLKVSVWKVLLRLPRLPRPPPPPPLTWHRHFSCAGPSPSILVAATSSDSDTEDEALQSSNSHYDNQTPPCTGSTPACLTLLTVSDVDYRCISITPSTLSEKPKYQNKKTVHRNTWENLLIVARRCWRSDIFLAYQYQCISQKCH